MNMKKKEKLALCKTLAKLKLPLQDPAFITELPIQQRCPNLCEPGYIRHINRKNAWKVRIAWHLIMQFSVYHGTSLQFCNHRTPLIHHELNSPQTTASWGSAKLFPWTSRENCAEGAFPSVQLRPPLFLFTFLWLQNLPHFLCFCPSVTIWHSSTKGKISMCSCERTSSAW